MKNKKTIASILSAATVLSMCVSPIGTLAKNKGSSEGVVSHAVNWVKTHVWQSATTATAAVASIVIVAIVKHNKSAANPIPKEEDINEQEQPLTDEASSSKVHEESLEVTPLATSATNDIPLTQKMRRQNNVFGFVCYMKFLIPDRRYSSMPQMVESGSSEAKEIVQLFEPNASIVHHPEQDDNLEVICRQVLNSICENKPSDDRDLPPFSLLDGTYSQITDALYYCVQGERSGPENGKRILTFTEQKTLEDGTNADHKQWTVFKVAPQEPLPERSSLVLSGETDHFKIYKIPVGQMPNESLDAFPKVTI